MRLTYKKLLTINFQLSQQLSSVDNIIDDFHTCLQGIPFRDSTRRGLKIGRVVSLCPQQEDELSPHVNTCISQK